MRVSDGSKIIAVDQTKKSVIGIIRDALLSIQNVRVPVNLLVRMGPQLDSINRNSQLTTATLCFLYRRNYATI